MATHRLHHNATSTIVESSTQHFPNSHILSFLSVASRAIKKTIVDDRIGKVENAQELGDDFIKSAYELISEANRHILRLEAEDRDELQAAFEKYVRGSTFITSALFGHMTNPDTVPVSFFGTWAYVQTYESESGSVPWFVVATALAWAQCAGRLWTYNPTNEHLPEEVRQTFLELAEYSKNDALVKSLQNMDNEQLLHRIRHLLQRDSSRDSVDKSLQDTVQLLGKQVSSMLPPSSKIEIGEMEASIGLVLRRLMKNEGLQVGRLMTPENEHTSLDEFIGLQFIGPRRLIARMSSTPALSDEAHAQALGQLHERVFQQMKRSVEASAAAKETNELVASHREQVWMGGFGMPPAVLNQDDVAWSERVSRYNPSTLQGSLAGERVDDFEEFSINDEDEEVGSDVYEDEGDQGSDTDMAFSRAVEERRQVDSAIEFAVGLRPASMDLQTVAFDDSQSSYAASSLTGFSGAWNPKAPSIVSGRSTHEPIGRAIGTRTNDPGPVLIPAEQTWAPSEDERSEYNPSLLSGLSVPRPYRSTVARIGEASFVPIEEEEYLEQVDPIETVTGIEMNESMLAATSRWAAQVTESMEGEENIIREGAATATLMDDNQTLARTLSVHRAGESELVLKLSQAHSELGQANEMLAAQNDKISRLQEKLGEEEEKYGRDIELLEQQLQSQIQNVENLKTALNALQVRMAEASKHSDRIQEESVQSMEELITQLNIKEKELTELQRANRELGEAHQNTRNQLTAASHELIQSSHQSQNVLSERDQLHTQLMQMSEEAVRRDAALLEMNTNVETLMQTNLSLKSEGEKITEERNQLKAQVEDLERTKHREAEAAAKRWEELSKLNRDLEDSLGKATTELANAERVRNTEREGHQLQTQQKDRELLLAIENGQRLETALGEVRVEIDEAHRVFEQVQSAVLQLRRAVAMSDSESSLTDQIREVATTIQVQKDQQGETDRKLADEVVRLARKIGVEVGHRDSVIDLFEEVRAKTEEHLQTVEVERNSLLELANPPNTEGNPTIASMPSTELVRLAQNRFANANATIEEARGVLINIARATGIEHPETATEHDLLRRITETMVENATMRQGLEEMTNVVVRSPPTDLIRLAQEKFRALSELAKESSNEISSLRRRTDNLQASLDQEKMDRQRENSDHIQKITNLETVIQQMQSKTLTESNRGEEYQKQLEYYTGVIARLQSNLETISREKNSTEEKLTRCENEWRERIKEIDGEARERDQIENSLREKSQNLEKTILERDAAMASVKHKNEIEVAQLQQQLQQCQENLQLAHRDLGRVVQERQDLQDKFKDEREQWQAQVDSFNQQLAGVDAAEVTKLRIERDRLNRRVSDLQVQLHELELVQTDRDQLTALNEVLQGQLRECEDARILENNVVQELRRQVESLEQKITETNASAVAFIPDTEEAQFWQEDSAPWDQAVPGVPKEPTQLEQRLQELGSLVAQREYDLARLEDTIDNYNTQLLDIQDEIERTEAILDELKDNIAATYLTSNDIPFSDDSSVEINTPLTPPTSPFVTVNFDQWKERFPTVKPSLCHESSKRWVLAFDEASEVRYDAQKLDSLLDPRMRYVHFEELVEILRQTLAFVVNLEENNPKQRNRYVKRFREFHNLHRIAVRANGYAVNRAFRLVSVCEFVVANPYSVEYQGAVLQRYCELIVELAMTVGFRCRTSAMQQRQRLVITAQDVFANDPNAIVVRFQYSPFQTFDRYALIKALAPNLIDARRGLTIEVPVDASLSSWCPREDLWDDLEDVVIPKSVPLLWVKRQLDRAASLVPGLVHVLHGEMIEGMQKDSTYVQVARLDGTDDCVLLVGQQDTWVVIDPLSTSDDQFPKATGYQIVGVIRVPRDVLDHGDRGFALMTWVREVFVHGLPIHEVSFRGESDREQCTLEHHLKCFLHP